MANSRWGHSDHFQRAVRASGNLGRGNTDRRVRKSLNQLLRTRVILLDISPRQLLRLAGQQIPVRYRRRVEHFRYGPGIFKIDYARTGHCRGFTRFAQRLEPFIWGEHSMRLRKRRPRLLTANARTDRSCCFPNRHYSMLRVRRRGGTFLWAYCHVPNGSSFDMTERVGEADWSLRAAVL
jgi:hypothetical protein